jgi:hypothetical protein
VSTSGTNTFTVTRDDAIGSVLRALGVTPAGVSPTTDDLTNCSQALNIMLKSWAKKGFPLWVNTNLTLPMISGLGVYPLGPTAGYIYSVSSTGGTGYTAGTWTAVGGTSGTPASGTYTVSGGAPAVFTILVAGNSYTSAPTSFTLSGAGTGATITGVVAGKTMSKPLRIDNALIRDSSNSDTMLSIISKQEYLALGNKTTLGTPNQVYYDPQLTTGYLSVYNVPSDSTKTLVLSVQRMFEDMTNGTDNFDFPQSWFQAIKWNLLAEVCTEYNIDKEMIPYYEQKAQTTLMEAFDESVEEAPVFFSYSNH